MFLLSPLVLIPLSLTLRKPYGFRKSMVLLFMLNTSSTFMPMAHKLLVPGYQKWVLVTIILNICQTGEVSRKCFFSDYDTQSKLIDYFIGMTLAVIMREDIEKPFLYMVKERHRAVSTVSNIIWFTKRMTNLHYIFSDYKFFNMDTNPFRNVVHSNMPPISWNIRRILA